MPETVDILLERWRQGDAEAGEQFIGQVYSELRRLAAYYFSGERSGHTLQPTAIVNELYLKMFSETPVEWKDRAHFFSVASRQIRRILIDHARRRNAQKRKDTQVLIPELGRQGAGRAPHENLLEVDEALEALENLDPRAAQVVELRVFGGLKEKEIGQALDISLATVKRDWVFARAWLLDRLQQ